MIDINEVKLSYKRYKVRIVIDGYNLLKQHHAAKQLSVSAFILLLKRYAKIKSHRIDIVFDGGESPWPSTYQEGCVTITYAGYGKTADELLVFLIQENGKNRWDLFVTSDRELIHVATAHALVTIRSHLFWQFLKKYFDTNSFKEQKKPSFVVKKGSNEDSYIDELMREGANMNDARYKNDELGQKDRDYSVKASKKERELARILKKL